MNIRFLVKLTPGHASPGHLPQDQAEAVHVGHDVGLEMAAVQALVQDLRRHVAFGTDPCVGRDVHFISVAEHKSTRAS